MESRHDLNKRRIAAWASLLWCAVLVLAMPVAAQTPALLYPKAVTSITVTPAVADIGVAREIKVSGAWPGCPAIAIDASGAQFSAATATRAARLLVSYPAPPCPGFLAYTQTFSFTPTARSKVRFLILAEDGEYLAETQIDTRAPDDNRSTFNISGMWYDPQSNGSGLTFIHSTVSDNAFFGTWYVYDTSGKPHWFSIQSAAWKSQGRVLEGILYETSAIASCAGVLTSCPASLGAINAIGRARITITGANSARVDALKPDDTLIFTSNIIRAEI